MRKIIVIATFVFILNLLIALATFRYFELSRGKSVYKNDTNPPSKQDVALIEKNTSTIILGGDVMLGRSVNRRAVVNNDFEYPLIHISDMLSSSDLVLVNLESPIVSDCPLISGGFTFCADPRFTAALKIGSIDIVNLSNNHIRNFGQKGIDNTKKILSENGISYTGLGEFVQKEINGITFGFLGFDYTVVDPSETDYDLVNKSDNLVDVLIVSVHWGDEYKAIHNAKQEKIANELVKNGADIIAGHHPHWVQDIEEIEGKTVFYSLGNLVFDQMWSEETKKGLMVKLNFEEGNLKNYEEIPIYVKEIGEPILVNND